MNILEKIHHLHLVGYTPENGNKDPELEPGQYAVITRIQLPDWGEQNCHITLARHHDNGQLLKKTIESPVENIWLQSGQIVLYGQEGIYALNPDHAKEVDLNELVPNFESIQLDIDPAHLKLHQDFYLQSE